MAVQHFAFAFMIDDAMRGIKLDASCTGNHLEIDFCVGDYEVQLKPPAQNYQPSLSYVRNLKKFKI